MTGIFGFVTLAMVLAIVSFFNFIGEILPNELTWYRMGVKKYERIQIDGELEPEMPSHFENKKTILGVDVNNNKIRDDIEIWINHNFTERNHRLAAKQFVTDLHYEIENLHDKQKIIDFYVKQQRKGHSCFHFIITSNEVNPYDQMSFKSYRQLNKLYYDNEERLKINSKISDHLSGHGIPSGANWLSFQDCNFKIDNFDYFVSQIIEHVTRGNYEEFKKSYPTIYNSFIDYKQKHGK